MIFFYQINSKTVKFFEQFLKQVTFFFNSKVSGCAYVKDIISDTYCSQQQNHVSVKHSRHVFSKRSFLSTSFCQKAVSHLLKHHLYLEGRHEMGCFFKMSTWSTKGKKSSNLGWLSFCMRKMCFTLSWNLTFDLWNLLPWDNQLSSVRYK